MTDTPKPKHPFLDDLAPNATLSGSLMRRPIVGRENIQRAVHATGTLYTSQTPILLGAIGNRTFLQYNAALHNGLEVHAVAVIERDDGGVVQAVSVTLGPLDAVLSLSGRLASLLEADLGRETFL